MYADSNTFISFGPAIRCYSGTKAYALILTGVSAAIRRRCWAVEILLGCGNVGIVLSNAILPYFNTQNNPI